MLRSPSLVAHIARGPLISSIPRAAQQYTISHTRAFTAGLWKTETGLEVDSVVVSSSRNSGHCCGTQRAHTYTSAASSTATATAAAMPTATLSTLGCSLGAVEREVRALLFGDDILVWE